MVDFELVNKIRNSIECVGYSAWTDTVDTAKLFTLPPLWLTAAYAIMKLPVASWDSPAAVSGEIVPKGQSMPFPPKAQTQAPQQPAAGRAARNAAPAQPAANTAGAGQAILDAIKALEDKVNSVYTKLSFELSELRTKLGEAPAGQAVETPRRRVAPAAANSQPAAAGASQAATTSRSAAPAKPSAAAGSAPPAADGDLESMSRAQLITIANSLGIASTGKKADDLRKLITEARAQNGDTGAQNNRDASGEMATILMQVIDDHYDDVKDFIEPVGEVDLENNKLGCGGDCGNCPNPEKHPTPADQIESCFTSIHQLLGIEVPQL